MLVVLLVSLDTKVGLVNGSQDVITGFGNTNLHKTSESKGKRQRRPELFLNPHSERK
jgi:hypothetical protein